jgi:hypothetical protein
MSAGLRASKPRTTDPWKARAVLERAVPVGDDDDGDAVAHHHLHRPAVERRAPEETRVVDVGDRRRP